MTKCEPEAQEILEYIAESPAAEHGGFDDRTIRAARWAVEKLAAARAEVERLRSALLCEDCNGTGWMYCGVADTSTPCRNCAAYEIRKAAAAAGGGE